MWTEENARNSRDGDDSGRGPRHGDGPKQPEQLTVSSGQVVVIDHFMLANLQFLDALPGGSASDAVAWVKSSASDIRKAVERYGGSLLEVESGSWGVNRDPSASSFTLSRMNGDQTGDAENDAILEARGNAAPIGRVFIDTRCVVFVDAGLLANRPVLEEYRRMRQEGQDKAARDLMRESGAAVRYGFNRDGDELGVFRLPDGMGYALWPDVVEAIGGGVGFDSAE